MPEKNKTTIINIDGDSWYTAGDAADVLTRNSGRKVTSGYVYKLGWLDKIRVKKVHARLTYYSKPDIDGYKVEARGRKSGDAQKNKSAARKNTNTK